MTPRDPRIKNYRKEMLGRQSRLEIRVSKRDPIKLNRMTLEALDDVKTGRTHEHAEIEAWARSRRARCGES